MLNILTARQEQVLSAIESGLMQFGRPPSIPELMTAMDVASPNGIAKHLHALENKGYITRQKGARGILINNRKNVINVIDNKNIDKKTETDTDKPVFVPIIGNIAAGQPILASEYVEESIPMPVSFTDEGSETFFLRVKGESMIDDGIMPGDLVMVSKCSSVANGELAAVILEDEATVKRFYKDGARIRLEPANPLFEPIIVDPKVTNCIVAGKIIGLVRSYKRKL